MLELFIRRGHVAAAALSLCAAPALAIGVTDGVGDYVSGFAGSRLGDLDVVGSFVTYNVATDKFVFSGTMESNIGTTPGGFYVWGVNRGAGTAAFAGNGVPGVLFDAIVRVNQDGSGTANGTPFAAGTAVIVGTTIIVQLNGSLFPSTGFAKTAYTWNLWPRDASQPAGFAQISDFAPDNSNLGVTVVGTVPEPGAWLMMMAGVSVLALRRRARV